MNAFSYEKTEYYYLERKITLYSNNFNFYIHAYLCYSINIPIENNIESEVI
jgi:hypothetical protein